jgi:SAM-dependent methyltransferase
VEEALTRPTHAVQVPCLACGADRYAVVCSAREIEAHHRYLLRFHKRRLRLDRKARVAESSREDRIDFTQDYATDIVACTACDLIFRNPRPPTEAVLDAYASERYAPEHLRTAFETHLELFRPKARVLARWLPRRERIRIVEVGSFVCSFLAAGREEGWEVLGVDPGEQAAAFCQAKGLAMHRGMITDLKLPPESVDCVAIWNTFDQLPDPHPTLQAVKEMLRPEGLLVIRIPSGRCFSRAMAWERRLPRWASGWLRSALAWNNLLTFPYLFGYSVATADRLMSGYGFQRIAVCPDTLVTLADPDLKWWAALEERLVKSACRLLANSEPLWGGRAYSTAPWLDLYYRNVAQASRAASLEAAKGIPWVAAPKTLAPQES